MKWIPRKYVFQLAAWVGVWLLFAYTGSLINAESSYYLHMVLRVLGLALIFNIVYYGFLPLYFKERKRAFYGWSIVLFLCYVSINSTFDYINFMNREKEKQKEEHVKTEPPKRTPQRIWVFTIIPSVFLGLVVIGAAASMKGFAAFEEKKKSEEDANRRRLEAEIALLKSQINPHFLLNTLNNLYALALTEPEKTPDALLKLSEMVGYILHDCAQPKVPLQHDIAFIANYLDLQQLRLPPNASLVAELPSSLPATLHIEPMVLIPFIENAFKHGLTTRQPCRIEVRIAVEQHSLHMTVQNDLLPDKTHTPEHSSGVGLSNTIQRLRHSYAGRHHLDISRGEGQYTVQLDLNLMP